MLLKLKVTPKARTNSLAGWANDKTLKVKVCAAPDNGKANQALIKLLARELHCASSRISIVHGEKSREKTVSIPDSLVKRLAKEKE